MLKRMSTSSQYKLVSDLRWSSNEVRNVCRRDLTPSTYAAFQFLYCCGHVWGSEQGIKADLQNTHVKYVNSINALQNTIPASEQVAQPL